MVTVRFDGVSKHFDDGTVAVDDFRLEVADGEFMILVGPSGCGKTTSLRMVAGFEQATSGQIYLGDLPVGDLEPGDRDVAMVFQNYALFPHMSVQENLGFPLRMRRVPKHEVIARVRETAEYLGMDGLLNRMPHELSGGQRQRVALGRALIRRPKVFLMDEPLSNLDAKLRAQMRAELARLHQQLGVTTLYVTHDQMEAMTLGSRVAVMRHGVLQQVGRPRELYRRPRNLFVARFIGSPPMNLIRGALRKGVLKVGGAVADVNVRRGGILLEDNDHVLIGVRAEAWRLRESDAGGDGDRLSISGTVEVVEDLGSEALVHFAPDVSADGNAHDEEGSPIQLFVARFMDFENVTPGSRITFHASSADLHLFDGDTEASLTPDVDSGGAVGAEVALRK